MGHQRLGSVPKTKSFAHIIELMSGNDGGMVELADDVKGIASITLDAVKGGLDDAKTDSGLQQVFFTLTQLVLASRDEDWRDKFGALGIRLANDSGMFEFVSELQGALQDRIEDVGRYSDVAEIARKSAVDAVKSLAGPNMATLFGSGPEELRDAVRKLSTKNGFAELGRTFFSGVLVQYVNFYLSKVTPIAVREGRLDGVEGLREFDRVLEKHCYQTARIVEDFCGDWYSKTEWREGIDKENSSRAVAFAIQKLQAELTEQGGKL